MTRYSARLLAAALVFGIAPPALAGEVTVTIANGRATIIAKDAAIREILAEWARVGDTRMVNAEKLQGGPVTLQLVDLPEKEALDILLRSAAGYITGPRPAGLAGASMFDRVMILATSRAPAQAPNLPPQPFNRPVMQQVIPQPPPEDDDDGEPSDQGPMPPGMQPGMVPGMQNPGVPFPGPVPGQAPGMPPAIDPTNPTGMPPGPMTAPRPGMLPQQPQPFPGAPLPQGGPGRNDRGGGPGQQQPDPDGPDDR